VGKLQEFIEFLDIIIKGSVLAGAFEMIKDLFNYLFRYRYSSRDRFESEVLEAGEKIADHYQRGNVYGQMGKRLTSAMILARLQGLKKLRSR
jgi:hypothetical protein